MKNIVFLYTRLAQYFLNGIHEFLKKNDEFEAHIIKYSESKLAPYSFKATERVYFYQKSDFSVNQLQNLVSSLKPILIYCTGWGDKDYLRICQKYRRNIPTVMGFDNPWKGTIKQKLFTSISKFILKKYFSKIWVPGLLQFEYARRLGFCKEDIIFNLYTANNYLFNSGFELSFADKLANYPKTMVFVGRFLDWKGISELYSEFSKLTLEQKNGWKLHLIGNGPLKKILLPSSDVIITDFMPPEELLYIATQSGFLCLPSWQEHWGVVVHEFSSAGLPLLCSDQVSSIHDLMIENYNGFTFKSKDREDLANKLIKIFALSQDELLTMSQNSYTYSKRISLDYWVYNIQKLIGHE